MQAELLQKIEELTLHLIAKEEELQNVNNKNADLENRVLKLERLLLKD